MTGPESGSIDLLAVKRPGWRAFRLSGIRSAASKSAIADLDDITADIG
jgi:hypothetical protein